MNRYRLYDISSRKLPLICGPKARSLQVLIRKGMPVPPGFVLPPESCRALLAGDDHLSKILTDGLDRVIGSGRSVAVRSSSRDEDGENRSFAGQFESFLHVADTNGIVTAIRSIQESAESIRAGVYRSRFGDSESRDMSVIVQRMVPPVFSGVAFSRNPLTGLDETIIEYVAGSGEALAQEGRTPFRWVSKWGEWTQRPDDAEQHRQIVEEVLKGVNLLSRSQPYPMDVEWVWDGARLWWVQLRPMTGLNDITIYSNRISREFLPGIILPLVWSVNIPVVNTAWIRLLHGLAGVRGLKPEDLARSFHYRAYFNMTAVGDVLDILGMPRESLELMLGIDSEGPEKPRFAPTFRTWLRIPRILLFLLRNLNFRRQAERFIRRTTPVYRSLETDFGSDMSTRDMLDTIEQVKQLTIETAYFNVLVPLVMQLTGRLLDRRIRKSGGDPRASDLLAADGEIRQLSPAFHLDILRRRYEALDERSRSLIRTTDDLPEDLQATVAEFIDRFGHFSDSGNDFHSPPWKEDPERVLSMILNHGGPGSRGYQSDNRDLPAGVRRSSTFRRARRYRLLREKLSSLYTYGYGLFRPLYREIGRRLADRGQLERPDDVFYLSHEEVVEATQADISNIIDLVASRRIELDRVRDLRLPTIIFGDDSPPIYEETGTRLKGTPTSRGYYSGTVRRIQKTDEQHRLKEGEVLVIPYSDVGWTPLFSRAGAVISESGGILSHSSIIAREYGIPAVVSVSGIMDLENGTTVSVDGYTGEIAILETVS